jgi:hypothetical protein
LYGDIETLSARGLIKSDLSSTKPFTRSEAGRLLAEAIDPTEKEDISTFPVGFLERMSKDYKDEISEVRTPGSAPGTFIKPVDEFSVSYNFLDGPFSIYNNEGIDYFDGSNTMVQFQSSGRLWNVFSFYIQPMFIYNQIRDMSSLPLMISKLLREEIQCGGGQATTVPFSCLITLNLLTWSKYPIPEPRFFLGFSAISVHSDIIFCFLDWMITNTKSLISPQATTCQNRISMA